MENFTNNVESHSDPIESVMSAEEYAEMKPEIPYVYEVSGDGAELLYFGARHSRSPEDGMFDDIEERFERFDADIVLVEGMGNLKERKEERAQRLRDHSREEVIDDMGESGFALKLAAEKDIDFISPEPEFSDEIKALEEQGFSKDEIFAYYFYRILPQWHRQQDKPDIKEYLEPHIKGMAKDAGWEDYDFSFEHAVKIGEKIWGESLQLEDKDYYHDRIDPIPWEDAKESQGVVNLVSRASSRFRDQYMVGKIAEVLKTHKRPFIVFGGSHAVMQEPAIRKLMKKEEGQTS